MTKVIIYPGVCGHSVTVTAKKRKDKRIRVSLETECEMVKGMVDEIAVLDIKTVFADHLNNPVIQSASRHVSHVACPVTSGILKAIEVEAGLSLPRDVLIEFQDG